MVAVPTVENQLATFKVSAVHLEMRDGYQPRGANWLAWRGGRPIDPDDRSTWWNPYYDLLTAAVDRGGQIRRARIVSEPVSEYIRYEHAVSDIHVAAGELLRWLPRRLTTDLRLPGNDFWLFDKETLIVTHLDGEGDVVVREYIPDPELTRFHVEAFEAVWVGATPHADYPLT